jgi:hypothetical protein
MRLLRRDNAGDRSTHPTSLRPFESESVVV